MKIYTAFLLLWLLVAIAVAIFSPYGSFLHVIGPLVMLASLPLLTYFGAVRNFTGNNRVSETVEYDFKEDFLCVKGESFNSQLSWEKIYKVTHTKDWLLIWHNRQVGNPISKREVSEQQMSELKGILDNRKVKNNL